MSDQQPGQQPGQPPAQPQPPAQQPTGGATGLVQEHVSQFVSVAETLANDVIDAGEGAAGVALGGLSTALHSLADAVDKIKTGLVGQQQG